LGELYVDNLEDNSCSNLKKRRFGGPEDSENVGHSILAVVFPKSVKMQLTYRQHLNIQTMRKPGKNDSGIQMVAYHSKSVPDHFFPAKLLRVYDPFMFKMVQLS
jgi:hypothetical protein